MIIAIMIYSKLPNALYELDLTKERIVKNGVTFNDFILKEKGVREND